ncbi:hypothetical protein G7072_02420 [Nocardioides sp. HDW12B]|uniref:hypothetical protein n=1 Tax=Nocardioides sp. HDW12B TaxID=2714939 RepID=UPI00140CC489|nr:hypothetical protein [Nocardioides sp. HDW12B]QIK65345.1 hypothetical protein G7072_02420 [Nocardioides sp. HDW12B]
MTSSRSLARAAAVTALALGVGGLTAAPAQAAWSSLATNEGGRLQACKVATADGAAWRVKARVRNVDDDRSDWVKARVVVTRNGTATDQAWSSGRVFGGESAAGTVRSGRGSAWTLAFSLSSPQSGGGGQVPVGALAGC